ncbi:MAG TPA: hypothetical protein VEJ41_00155 [Candidatus Acidoferrales bacterium]|nr:hypothetical protein [Candidatus Acidoferrales bacterium]
MRNVKGANGFILARVDASGNVTLGPDPGPIVGKIGEGGQVYDDDAGVHQVGLVDGAGTISDMYYENVGKVDAWGRTYTPLGELLGTVEKPRDAGVLIFLAGLVETKPQPEAPAQEDSSLMDEALDLAQDRSFPSVRKDAKPLTERDLFTERLRRE